MKCYQCKVCNGQACKGQIPGVGGIKTGASFINNVNALAKIQLNMSCLHEINEVDCSVSLFNQTLDLPVMAAPIANVKGNYGVELTDKLFNQYLVEGCQTANTIAFTGDDIDPEQLFYTGLKIIDEHEGQGIITMKPWVKEGIDLRLKMLETMNYLALAMDVDSCAHPLLKQSKIPAEAKDAKKLQYIVEKIKKPFIVKGVMSIRDAQVALDAKADYLIVSNHGGRVLDQTRATIDVLAEIVAYVDGRCKILIDGGFRSGYDVFKAIALGADGVLIGRPLALEAIMNQADGVTKSLLMIKKELEVCMLMTGCKTIDDITSDKITF